VSCLSGIGEKGLFKRVGVGEFIGIECAKEHGLGKDVLFVKSVGGFSGSSQNFVIFFFELLFMVNFIETVEHDIDFTLIVRRKGIKDMVAFLSKE
jgi:hypothetical protein